jgi:hypothetical protein
MGLTEVREDTQQQTQNTNKESDDEKEDLPVRDSATPQETPVPPIGLENRPVSISC